MEWPRVVAAVVRQHLLVVDGDLVGHEGVANDEILKVDRNLHRALH